MTKLILVRHGESLANVKDVFAGHFDIELSELGFRQANLTAEYIRNNYKVDKIYSSDLKRAFSTAKVYADSVGLAVSGDKNLREIYSPLWDDINFKDILKKFREDFLVWINDFESSRCTNGESVKEVGDRVYNFLTLLAKQNEGKTILVTSHATPIRTFLARVKGVSPNVLKWVSNASVSVFNFEYDTWSCEKVGYDDHLANLVTRLPDNV
ncbi:MAG: histidine phosphatase family protein [Clostridiales bacterium]|nr:histidine phosphatase family protein [Clostridiales bacterium]